MKQIIKYLSYFPFVFLSIFAYSQEDGSIFTPTALPSVNASSFGTFGTYSANKYAGQTSVQIPIYKAISGDIELPISLSYNTNGIKVSDEASWVGLGWNVNIGGVITRRVYGLDDFKEYKGYISCGEMPSPNNNMLPQYNLTSVYSINNSNLYSKMNEYYNGMEDSQPDIFSANFFGNSFQLFFQKQTGTIIKATSVKFSNFIFEYDLNNKKWTVTGDNGWQYIFETKEITKYKTSSSSYTFIDYPISNFSEDIITSWYLDKVITSSGEILNFYYDDNSGFYESQPYYDEISTYGPISSFSINNLNGLMLASVAGNHLKEYSASVSFCHDKYLNKIVMRDCYIEFETEDRFDIKIYDALYPSQALKKIKIFNNSGKIKKIFEFGYSYFNIDKLGDNDKENYLRLKLTSLKEGSEESNGVFQYLPEYKFYYNEMALPKKNSASGDFWGYFNNSENSIQNYQNIDNLNILSEQPYPIEEDQLTTTNTLKPRYTYFSEENQYYNKVFINGKNKEADLNYAKVGILEKIQYPTGGLTEFVYELNSYSGPLINNQSSLYKDIEVLKEVTSNGQNEATFTVPENGGFVLLTYNFNIYIPNSLEIMNSISSGVFMKQSDYSWKKIINNNTYDIHNLPSYYSSHACFFLEKGTYKLCVDNASIPQVYLRLTAKIVSQDPTLNLEGDGLRIKSIINKTSNDEIVNNIIYEYNYENNQSSGVLMNHVETFYNETSLSSVYPQPPFPGDRCCFLGSINPFAFGNFIVTWAQGILPISYYCQNHAIGYSLVREKELDKNGNTLSILEEYYKNVADEEIGMYFPGIPTQGHLSNGQLTKTLYRNSDNALVKEISYIYEPNISHRVNIYGIKTMIPKSELNKPVLAAYYNVQSEHSNLRYKTTKTYTSSLISDYISEIVTYDYDLENGSLIKESCRESNGNVKEYIFRYPKHIEGLAFYNQMMVSKNIISKPIETLIILNNEIIDGTILNYISRENGILLNKEYILNVNSPIPKDHFTFFNYYPDNGYILEKEILKYDEVSRPINYYNNVLERYSSVNYGINGEIICRVDNAMDSEFGYTGFEDNFYNGWISQSYNTFDHTDSFTGKACLLINGVMGPKKNIQVSRALNYSGYSASVWVKGSKNACLKGKVNGVDVVFQSNVYGSQDKWSLLKIEIPKRKYNNNDIISILVEVSDSQTTKIDDIRVNPTESSMVTYTKDHLVGITSMSDNGNSPQYYMYDVFGRLIIIKDSHKNIIKKYEYNYKN